MDMEQPEIFEVQRLQDAMRCHVQQPMDCVSKTQQEGMQNNAKTILKSSWELISLFMNRCFNPIKHYIPNYSCCIEYPVCPMIFRHKSHEPCWFCERESYISYFMGSHYQPGYRYEFRGIPLVDCGLFTISWDPMFIKHLQIDRPMKISRNIEFIMDFPRCSTIFLWFSYDFFPQALLQGLGT